MTDLLSELSHLSAAEEFFEALDVPFDPHVVRVNRLHILKRFHDYVGKLPEGLEGAAQRQAYAEALAQAHDDFVKSDAVTEGVFKVFKQVRGRAFVGLGDLEPMPRG